MNTLLDLHMQTNSKSTGDRRSDGEPAVYIIK
jgi:hypothetical protein